METPFKIFIGYDARESVASYVCADSILQHTEHPISFTFLKLENLTECYDRPRDTNQSTDFAFSRFLTPYLSGYQGWSLFVDCDFVFTDDVRRIFDCMNDQKSVLVCQHSYTPKTKTKFLGQNQTNYPRKNWSSLMLFNNSKCKALTPEKVCGETGKYLHQFEWTRDELIGELPLDWNFLVGEYSRPNKLPRGIHYTLGGPYFSEYRRCDFSSEWYRSFQIATSPLSESPKE